MARASSQRQGRQDRWPEVLRAASEVFGAKGYPAASLQEVAEKLGILKGSLYHYARTKEDLLYAMLVQGHESALATLRLHQDLGIEAGSIRLESFIRLWMQNGRALLFPEISSDRHDITTFLSPGRRNEIRRIRRTVTQYVVDLISDEIFAGHVRHDIRPELAANTLLVIINGSYEWVGESDADWEGATEWYVTLFSSGVTRERSTPAQPEMSIARKAECNSLLSPEPTKEASRADRWDELVAVAARLFAEKTYSAASLSELATRMGMRKASLYHYIGAKEELLFELQLRAHVRALEVIREDSVLEHASARDRLAHLILAWSEGVMKYGSTYWPVGTTDLKFLTEDHAAQLRSKREAVQTHVRSIVEQGITEGDFDPALNPRGVADTLLISLNGSPRWYRSRSGGSSLGYWHIQLFLRGLVPAACTSSRKQGGSGKSVRH